jgi:hypothetical protein
VIQAKKRRNLIGVSARVREGEHTVEVKGRVDGRWVVLGEVSIPPGMLRIKVAAVRTPMEE